jgi:hypothetical protein
MSNHFFRVLGGALFVIASAAVGVEACGSDSNSGGPSGNSMATCNQVCDKIGTCLGDAGGIAAQAVAQCKMSCGNPSSGQTCTNQDAIVAKVNECLAIADCGGFLQCAQGIPPCQGGTATTSAATTTGAGGGTGTGGTGTGGGSGASCDSCTKADGCCVALGGTADQCQYATSCNMASGATRDQFIGICDAILQGAASNPNAPAACK